LANFFLSKIYIGATVKEQIVRVRQQERAKNFVQDEEGGLFEY
jgi:hypothetical protein